MTERTERSNRFSMRSVEIIPKPSSGRCLMVILRWAPWRCQGGRCTGGLTALHWGPSRIVEDPASRFP